MKSLYSSLALLLIAAIVGAWIYFQERGPVAQVGSTVLLRVQPASVQSFAIQPASGGRLEILRENDVWQVRREGINKNAVPADEDVVENLLEAVQLVQSGAVVAGGASTPDLKAFGLASPVGSLMIGEAKIEFGGKPSFDPSKIYARVTSSKTAQDGETSQIALLPASLGDFLNKSFNDWRDKAALRIEPKAVDKLVLTTAKGKTEFERIAEGDDESGADDFWRITTPIAGRADTGTIRAFLAQLPLTQISKFLEDEPQNLARWGLEPPTVKITVTTDKGESTLMIGKPLANASRKVGQVGEYAARNSTSKVVFAVPDRLLSLLARPLRDWRDKSVIPFSLEDVQTLKVNARQKQASFARNGDNWQRTDAENNATAAHQAALDVLLGLQKLTARNFVDKPQALSTYGFDKPALDAELTSSEWSADKRIQLAVKNNRVHARVAEGNDFESTIYVLEPNALQAFQTALDVTFPAKR